MIHLKQYYDGILIQKSLTDSIVYNGIKFSPTTSYNERPWERDAYTNQDIMLAKIKDLMYEKRIDYKAINTHNGEVTKRVVIKYKVGRKRKLVLSTNINADQQLTAVSVALV